MRPVARITVAVAACDRPAPLARCLEAIARGATLPSQLVVVDQSADGAVEAEVAKVLLPGVAVHYIRQPRRGLSASRNAALAAATQPAIAFTDDDCVPDRAWLAALQDALAAEDPPAAVAGRVLPLGEPSEGTYVVSPRAADQPTEYRAGAVPWAVGTGGNFAASRAWLDRVGRFDERLGAGRRCEREARPAPLARSGPDRAAAALRTARSRCRVGDGGRRGGRGPLPVVARQSGSVSRGSRHLHAARAAHADDSGRRRPRATGSGSPLECRAP